MSKSDANVCLENAALEYYQNQESALIGVTERTYGHGGVVLGIEPAPRLTWGYWGAAIRALNSMWASWDAIELEFVIGVEEEGILGHGFLKTIYSES